MWTWKLWRAKRGRSNARVACAAVPTSCDWHWRGDPADTRCSALQRGGERRIASLTEDALIQRLHAAVPYLQAVVSQLLVPVKPTPCWHGRVLRVADGSSLSKPASKGTDWRIHGVYDLGRGGFTHLEITDNHGGEALDRGEPAAGEIRIGDRNYANAQAWQRFLLKRDGQTDFIVRMRWNTVKLLDEAGAPFDLVNWLQTQPGNSETHEITAWARSGKHQMGAASNASRALAALPVAPPIEIRLIARRKPQEAIEAEHKRLRQNASRKQTKLDPRSLIAAEYVILATSLAKEEFPTDEVLAVYRLRWQIELAFKRLKSLLHIDALRTRTEAGTRCWLYAHLIVALLGDDLSQDFLESFPSGPV
jgi:Transposase DDE domain